MYGSSSRVDLKFNPVSAMLALSPSMLLVHSLSHWEYVQLTLTDCGAEAKLVATSGI